MTTAHGTAKWCGIPGQWPAVPSDAYQPAAAPSGSPAAIPANAVRTAVRDECGLLRKCLAVERTVFCVRCAEKREHSADLPSAARADPRAAYVEERKRCHQPLEYGSS